ncbi:MAG: redoxin domain-containing protein, partial [Verrucomicrobia subdivision 3 bacterium]|nr:redoxin domain-containing protein [Limisphaerales bacterium]
ITNDGLAHLATLQQLETLSLDGTPVTQEGLAHLAPLKNLAELRFYNDLGDEGARHLAKVPSLKRLTAHLEVTEQGIEAIATLPAIEELDLTGDGITDQAAAHLARATSLKGLSFQNCPLTDNGLRELGTLTNLERLRLNGTRVSGEGLEALSGAKKLWLLGVNFGSDETDYHGDRPSLKAVAKLTGLTWFEINGDGVANDDLKHLSPLMRLDYLEIDGLPVNDEGAVHLGGLTSLKQLDLESGAISDVGLAHIANLERLEYLDLKGHFTDEGLKELKRLRHLEYAQLSSPYFSEAGARALSELLPSLRRVNRVPYRSSPYEVSFREGDTFRRQGLAEQRAAKNALEGNAPPQWHLTGWLNADSDSATPQSLVGKVVIVDFWGTWCGPCIAELPRLRMLHEKYSDQGLVIVGIHTTSGGEDMPEFVVKEQLRWMLAVDVNEETATAWKVDSYPSVYLIDRRGKLRVANIFRDDLERAVRELLSEDASSSAAGE